jgi:hypothetical protein
MNPTMMKIAAIVLGAGLCFLSKYIPGAADELVKAGLLLIGGGALTFHDSGHVELAGVRAKIAKPSVPPLPK